jgi:hypothetical protein
VTVTAQQVYGQLLAQLAGQDLTNSTEAWDTGNFTVGANDFATLMTASPVRYASKGGAQAPQVVPPEKVVSGSEFLQPYSTVPLQDVFPDLTDTAVRALVEHDTPVAPSVPDPPPNINGWLNDPQLNLVGTFNPGTVSDGSSALSAVPMQTYFPDTAAGADPASARALGGEPLAPNGNTAGLLSVSPSLLTTISSLPELENADSFTNLDSRRRPASRKTKSHGTTLMAGPAEGSKPGACDPMALLSGDLPGVGQVELDSPGDVGDAGFAGLAGGEVAGLLGFPRAGAVRAAAAEGRGVRTFSRNAARATSAWSGGKAATVSVAAARACGKLIRSGDAHVLVEPREIVSLLLQVAARRAAPAWQAPGQPPERWRASLGTHAR